MFLNLEHKSGFMNSECKIFYKLLKSIMIKNSMIVKFNEVK